MMDVFNAVQDKCHSAAKNLAWILKGLENDGRLVTKFCLFKKRKTSGFWREMGLQSQYK